MQGQRRQQDKAGRQSPAFHLPRRHERGRQQLESEQRRLPHPERDVHQNRGSGEGRRPHREDVFIRQPVRGEFLFQERGNLQGVRDNPPKRGHLFRRERRPYRNQNHAGARRRSAEDGDHLTVRRADLWQQSDAHDRPGIRGAPRAIQQLRSENRQGLWRQRRPAGRDSGHFGFHGQKPQRLGDRRLHRRHPKSRWRGRAFDVSWREIHRHGQKKHRRGHDHHREGKLLPRGGGQLGDAGNR